MDGVWRKTKKALGAGLCVHLPAVAGDREDGGASEPRASDAVSLDSTAAAYASAPNTPAATATATAEARSLRRSISGGKSSKVRSFLPLPSPSTYLPSFPVKICVRFAGNLAREVPGKHCGLRCGMSQGRRPACRPLGFFGWSWVRIGAMWLPL